MCKCSTCTHYSNDGSTIYMHVGWLAKCTIAYVLYTCTCITVYTVCMYMYMYYIIISTSIIITVLIYIVHTV